MPLLLAVLAFVWMANSGGILSSNDGSHIALARALALRGETSIDPERALTLEIDLAERAGHAYSDRPPGTGFAALWAVWLGNRLDPPAFERAMQQAKAGREVEPLPGPLPYITTYAARVGEGSTGPNLAKLIGTSVVVSVHAVLVGLLGMLAVHGMLRRMPELDGGARLFAVACVGLATAWGPYSTTLFSHGSAATAVAGFLLGVLSLERSTTNSDGRGRPSSSWIAALTGLAGTWAIACDYLLVVAIVPAALLTVPWRLRTWVALGLGGLPIVVATLAYHHAAFASPLAIGYDYQSQFEFARERGSTFSGELLDGVWTLWGLGRGAGLLAQAPVVLIGIVTVVALRIRPGFTGDGARTSRDPSGLIARALLGFLPWMLGLALHRTPWGGGTHDHRYLIPIIPFAAVGLGLAWAKTAGKPGARALLIGVTLVSAGLVWRHFLGWHEAEPFARPELGAAIAVPVLLAGLLTVRVRRGRSPENMRS